MSVDKPIASSKFKTAVKKNRKLYRIDSFAEELRGRKVLVKLVSSSIRPCVNKDYHCLTCGSRDGKCHPITSYCYHCNTDNWEASHMKHSSNPYR